MENILSTGKRVDSKTWSFFIFQRWRSTLTLLLTKAPFARGKFQISPSSRTRKSFWTPAPRSPRGRVTSSRPTRSPSTSGGASALWMRTRTDTDPRSSRAPSASWQPHPTPRPGSAWARCPPRCHPAPYLPLTSGSPWCRASAPRRRSTFAPCGTRMWWVCWFTWGHFNIISACALDVLCLQVDSFWPSTVKRFLLLVEVCSAHRRYRWIKKVWASLLAVQLSGNATGCGCHRLHSVYNRYTPRQSPSWSLLWRSVANCFLSFSPQRLSSEPGPERNLFNFTRSQICT